MSLNAGSGNRIVNIYRIESLKDVRLRPYRDLKDRELAREGGCFIAEGEQIVRRLLASDFPVESVLVAQQRFEAIAPLIGPQVPVLVVPDELIHQIVGFKFHSGVIACGRRKPNRSLDELLRAPAVDPQPPRLVLALPETVDPNNLGSLVRVGAGFGAAGMLLGPRCCDPFWRRSIRVSMGTIFSLPVRRSEDLVADLMRLREDRGFQLVAAVLDPDAEPLADAERPARGVLLLGGEDPGLDPDLVKLCARRITIPMKLGTDSLNVAVAAAVFLYRFCEE